MSTEEVKSRPARVNPQHLPTPPAVFAEKTFTDSRQPGVEVYVRLGYVTDSSFGLAIDEREKELIEAYVTGRNGGPKGAAPRFGGRSVEMTPAMCRILSFLEKMNALGDPENKYTFDDWCAFSITMPEVFNAASNLCMKLVSEGEGVKKNELTAGEVIEPDSPLTSESDTRNSSNAATPSDSESTGESANS